MSIQNDYSSYIENIFQKSDDYGLILSRELYKSEIDIIYDFINTIYKYLTDYINQPNTLEYDNGTSEEISEIETRELYNKRIDAILRDKELVEQWYKSNNIYVPGTAEARKHDKIMDDMRKKVLTKFKKRKEIEAKTGFPMLRKKDAFAILTKYENKDYRPTTAEKNNIIKHRNFKKYTTQYTKNWKVQYPNAVKILKEKGRISLKDFYSLCQCPNSDFFRKHLVESFKYECTNPRGRFYENKKFRDIKPLKRRNEETDEFELVFII